MQYLVQKHKIISEIYANLSLHKLEDIVKITLVDDKITLVSFKYGTGLSYFCVPRGVEVLAPSCLSSVELSVVTVSQTVEQIGYGCFANCANLRIVRVPSALSKFDSLIRYGNNAKVIYF